MIAVQVMRALAAALLVAALSQPAAADDAALRAALQSTLDHFFAVSRGGDIDAAMADQPQLRAMYDGAIADKRPPAEVRQRMAEFLKSMAPESYEVLYVAAGKDGTNATLIINGKRPPGGDPQAAAVSEVEYEFARSGDRWTIGQVLASPPPDRIKRPPEDAFEPESAYTDDRHTTLGGRIRGVRFADDHTMVAVRVLDEDQLAYLPPAATLRQAGFDPDNLRLFRIVEIEGIRHPTKDYKLWATGLAVVE